MTTRSDPPTRTARRAETERRDAVYRAAMTLIAERGIDATRISDIGRLAGMSAGHVMYYFGTKERLLLETLRWSEAELGAIRAAALRHGRAGWPKLRHFTDIYLPDGVADPRWMLWIETWRIRAADLSAPLDALERRWRDDLEHIVRDGAGRGIFREVAVDDFAIRYIALLDGLAIEIVEGIRDRRSVLAIAERGARIELEPRASGPAAPGRHG
jgi:AcrR family transcriptional regulator